MWEKWSKTAILLNRPTKLTKRFNFGLQDVLIVLVTIFDGKQDRVELADCPYVLMSQRREWHAYYWRRGHWACHGVTFAECDGVGCVANVDTNVTDRGNVLLGAYWHSLAWEDVLMLWSRFNSFLSPSVSMNQLMVNLQGPAVRWGSQENIYTALIKVWQHNKSSLTIPKSRGHPRKSAMLPIFVCFCNAN